MRIQLLRAGASFIAALMTTLVPAHGDPVKILFINGTEIFVSSGGGEQPRQVTADGTEKYLPVWSKDGSMIAFVKTVPDGQALGNLVVIDENGRLLQTLLFRRAEDFAGGMRFIESLEWLGRDRIAISGSVNPSLTETAIVDLATGTEQGRIFDDGPGADFSPDGKHFVYSSGSPHFTPESNREPALYVDYARVFPEKGSRIRFVSGRRWSPDSEQVAVVALDPATKRQTMIVWSGDDKVSEAPVTIPSESIDDLLWSGSNVVISSQEGEQQIVPGKRDAGASEPLYTPSILQKVRLEKSRLLEAVKRNGGRDADLWCDACPWTALPRKVVIGSSD